MRIAVASDDGISIAEHFGRSAGFVIFDVTENQHKQIEHRPNASSHHRDQAECEHHVHEESNHGHESFLTALHDCQVIICRGMGMRAIADLTANGIKPVITMENIPAHEAAKQYVLGRLDQSGESKCCSH